MNRRGIATASASIPSRALTAHRLRHEAVEEQIADAVRELLRAQRSVGAIPLVRPQHGAEKAERRERRIALADLTLRHRFLERALEELHVLLHARLDRLHRIARQRR